MKTFFAAALCAFASANDMEGRFMQWISEHGRSYGTVEEYKFRMAEFARTDAQIENHNQSNSTYTQGHNKMSDWTSAEYKRLLGYRAAPAAYNETPELQANYTYPTSVDWVTAGAVTPIKNQEQCGSCWAFSSTGAMEGMWKINHGSLISLSEEQLVQCVNLCYGCNGGNTEVKTSGSSNVTANSVSAMKTALATQPVSIAIEADQSSFSAYQSGVFDNTSCGTALDHAVLLVGYGSENGQEYYLMKNSWGTSWGEAGYMKMAIIGNGPGICGCQMQGNFPKH